jgi:hypothetical protein
MQYPVFRPQLPCKMEVFSLKTFTFPVVPLYVATFLSGKLGLAVPGKRANLVQGRGTAGDAHSRIGTWQL